MKKIMTILFILLMSVCKAATGEASDGPIMAVAVILFILLIVGTGYFIDFMKSKLKEFRTRRLIKKHADDEESEFLNSFNKANHEWDGISTF